MAADARVALVEELNLRRRHGDAYETYRCSAPFLFPVPRVVARLLSAPARALVGRERPERMRESAPVRREAVIALLRIGSSEARPALQRALADPDWEVRVYAAEALKRL